MALSGSQRESLLAERVGDDRVRCHVCPWRCTLSEGQVGVCQARTNRGGTLTVLNYGEVAAAGVDPIEKKPLYHFFPGSKVLSLGTWGCNLRCKHCQNWEVSYARWGRKGVAGAPAAGWNVDGTPVRGQMVAPAEAVAMARRHGCRGIAWTYNEPAIWLEYAIDVARLARRAGLYTVFVTSGYMTEEALDLIGPHLDALRIDVKGFTDRFYFDLARLQAGRALAPVLAAAVRAQRRWGAHVEVATSLIPTWNDAEEELRGTARWIKSALGETTPWHLAPFHPDAELRHLPRTPLDALRRARAIGLDEGLRYVYVGQVPGLDGSHTDCRECGFRAIGRDGYAARSVHLSRGGGCGRCGFPLHVRLRRRGRPAVRG